MPLDYLHCYVNYQKTIDLIVSLLLNLPVRTQFIRCHYFRPTMVTTHGCCQMLPGSHLYWRLLIFSRNYKLLNTSSKINRIMPKHTSTLIAVGEHIWLSMRFILFTHLSRNLNINFIESFSILEHISPIAFHLQQLVFHHFFFVPGVPPAPSYISAPPCSFIDGDKRNSDQSKL